MARNTHSVAKLVPQHDVEAALVAAQQRVEAALGDLDRGGRAWSRRSLRRKRDAIIGVSVSDDERRHRDASSVTVTANSRNRRPMMPPISSSGMNTATSEMLIERMVKPISPEPLSAASNGFMPLLDVAHDVLEHDDGVVDHEADRDGQRHQREVVEAVAEQIHQRRRCRAATAAP